MITRFVQIALYSLYQETMKITSDTWSIKKLVKKRDLINPKPQYQRTPVWSTHKKIFLIDSILREYDLPKFYIKRTPHDPNFDFEVTDGQQRMRAIWEFMNDDFCIEGKEFKNSEYYERYYSELPEDCQKKLKTFELSFSIIEEASQEEIRTLFARLQMGMTLIPVELRHALASNIGNSIFMVSETHKFFGPSCKIQNKRFKHQDYLDHVVALAYYKNRKDIKAPTLYQLYIDLADTQLSQTSELFKKINKILDWMFEINEISKGIFQNKWGFVDTFWLLFQNFENIKSVNYRAFSENFIKFELKRKKFNPNPEELIGDKTSRVYDKDLFDYIEAFNRQGSLKRNISIRSRVFDNKFNNPLNFNF